MKFIAGAEAEDFFFFIGQVYWVTLADHTKLDLLLQTSATVVTYNAMVLVVAYLCYNIYIVIFLNCPSFCLDSPSVGSLVSGLAHCP